MFERCEHRVCGFNESGRCVDHVRREECVEKAREVLYAEQVRTKAVNQAVRE